MSMFYTTTLLLLLSHAYADSSATTTSASANANTSKGCYRPPTGSVIRSPLNYFPIEGSTQVVMEYRSVLTTSGELRYCFIDMDTATESPTLRMRPGDTLLMTVHNVAKDAPSEIPPMYMGNLTRYCDGSVMTPLSLNVHFHGLTSPPICHGDDVSKTIINAGEYFTYAVTVPKSQPPGMYWYHPHVHGLVTSAIMGGASGAIIIDGIEDDAVPSTRGLPEQVLVIRDHELSEFDDDIDNNDINSNNDGGGMYDPGPKPTADLSINYVMVPYPLYTPAILQVPIHPQRQLWRVVNAAAMTLLDIEVVYDGVPQPLEIVAIDGVPLPPVVVAAPKARPTSTTTYTSTSTTYSSILGDARAPLHYYLPNGGRVEFIVTTPAFDSSAPVPPQAPVAVPTAVPSQVPVPAVPVVLVAELRTRNVDTGPGGDSSPARPLLRLVPCTNTSSSNSSSASSTTAATTATTTSSAAVIPSGSNQRQCGRTSYTIPNVTASSPNLYKGKSTKPTTGSSRSTGSSTGTTTATASAKAGVISTRYFYFSQSIFTDADGAEAPVFFITEEGKTPVAFSGNMTPAVVVERGAIEDWVITNRSPEVHVFHIHQLHFTLVAIDRVPLPKSEWLRLDSIALGPDPAFLMQSSNSNAIVVSDAAVKPSSAIKSNITSGSGTARRSSNLRSTTTTSTRSTTSTFASTTTPTTTTPTTYPVPVVIQPFSVTLRMDFSGDIEGVFVYHCHILEHEDRGMMAYIQVVPPCTITKCSTSSSGSSSGGGMRRGSDLLRDIYNIGSKWFGYPTSTSSNSYSDTSTIDTMLGVLLLNPVVLFVMVMVCVGTYHITSRLMLPLLYHIYDIVKQHVLLLLYSNSIFGVLFPYRYNNRTSTSIRGRTRHHTSSWGTSSSGINVDDYYFISNDSSTNASSRNRYLHEEEEDDYDLPSAAIDIEMNNRSIGSSSNISTSAHTINSTTSKDIAKLQSMHDISIDFDSSPDAVSAAIQSPNNSTSNSAK